MPGLPLRPGRREDFARLRTRLLDLGFTTAAVRERTGVSTMQELRRPPAPEVRDPLDVLLGLFVYGQPVARAAVLHHLEPDTVALLEGFGLLQHSESEPDTSHAPLALYPVYGLYIVSDQYRTVAGVGSATPVDAVYPALASTTLKFLAALPTSPCDSLLDIGAGTGIAALLAASGHARHAWAADVTARATEVAVFNARLNGIENVTVVQGDLFEPVAGLTFDRIVSHPPYMPAGESPVIFRDGGEDGEQLIRRIVAGLPAHLRPGGRFYCRCIATDRKGQPLEQRLREMLGDRASDFDVLVITKTRLPPTEFFCQMLAGGGMTARDFERQVRVFGGLGVESVVGGFVIIERHATPASPVTARRSVAGDQSPPANVVDWLLGWERAAIDSEIASKLLGARPTVAPAAEIRILFHHKGSEGLGAAQCIASTDYPFAFTLEAPPGVALLLGRCDGSRTAHELYNEMKEAGAVPADAPIEQFLQLVRILVGGGVLETEEFRLPVHEAVSS